MPIPQITFWCGVTYTGPWRSYTQTYTRYGETTTQTFINPATTEEFTWTDIGTGSTTTTIETYIRPATTETWTFSTPGDTYIDATTYPDPNYYPYGWDPCADNTATVAWAVPVGVILGLYALGLVIAAIVYKKRQKKRKAWYRPMAAYYKGGLPYQVKPRVPGA